MTVRTVRAPLVELFAPGRGILPPTPAPGPRSGHLTDLALRALSAIAWPLAVLVSVAAVAVAVVVVTGWCRHPLHAAILGADRAARFGIAAAAAAAWLLAGWVVAVPAAGGWLAAQVASTVRGDVLTGPRRRRVADAGRGTLRIVSANVLCRERTVAQVAVLADALQRSEADVIVTVETTARTGDLLTGAMGCYRLAAVGSGDRGHMVYVWVRGNVAVVDDGQLDVGTGTLPTVTVDRGFGPVTVVGVHLTAPVSRRKLRRWTAELAALCDLAGDGQLQRCVLAGDFNATVHHPLMGELLGHLTDAAADAGTRPPRTWPRVARGGTATALMAIDHVLLPSTVAAATLRTVEIPDSDHLGLCADLAAAARTVTAATPHVARQQRR